MYFTHYSCAWSLFFNAALRITAFSTVSFRKLVFRLSVLCLNQNIKICIIMLWNFWALGQLPPREIAPNPNSNANPKPNLTPIGAGGNCPNTVILICSFPKYQAIYKNSAVLCKKHAFREVSSSSKEKHL